MDNLPAHKIAAVRDAIAVADAQFFLLPPYSPDMNPIEMVFSKLKTLVGPGSIPLPLGEPGQHPRVIGDK
jgi:hypothetical protein